MNKNRPIYGPDMVSLCRALSKMGYCSRTEAERLVSEGKVRVNGSLKTNPSVRVDMKRDVLTVEGVKVAAAGKEYWMFNKPRGCITTANDPEGRTTIYDLLPHALCGLNAVGRLDRASEGLLLLSNDTVWSNAIIDPKTHLDKIYHVQIEGEADDSLLECLRDGVLSDGDMLRMKNVSLLRSGDKNCWLEICLDEGKSRHIRRMMAVCEREVLRLVRVSIGPLSLGELAKGECRVLTADELKSIRERL
jgi:23S rRNA pseudouridine2605 synthase